MNRLAKPSDVILTTPPLIGTMGRSEREHAAALLVRCCQVNGDEWQAVSPKMIGDVIESDIEAKTEPVSSWNRNPFFRPDFPDLAKHGFAVMGDDRALSFTEKGLKALVRWTP